VGLQGNLATFKTREISRRSNRLEVLSHLFFKSEVSQWCLKDLVFEILLPFDVDEGVVIPTTGQHGHRSQPASEK
jgi:hypothetical protein